MFCNFSSIKSGGLLAGRGLVVMAYIDRETAIKTAVENYKRVTQFDAMDLADAMESIPTADVEEVVRCKDCAIPHNKWTGCPKLNGLIPPPDFFCSYGERK